MIRRLDAGICHSSNRPPNSSNAAPKVFIGEIGAAGPLPAGTPVGKEGWVSTVVCSVVVISLPELLVDVRVVSRDLVRVLGLVVVSREMVLGVVFSFGGGGMERVVLGVVRVGG